MSPSQKDLRLLYQRSGNRCAFPDYLRVLDAPGSDTDAPVILSDVAQIVAQQPDGPRGHYPLPLEKRDNCDNLMLLCQEHHRLIDQQPHRFTVERLRQMKADHERRIRQVTGCGNC